MACTWASAFSPENSSQIFWRAFCGDCVLARSQAARRSRATKVKVDRALRRSMLKEMPAKPGFVWHRARSARSTSRLGGQTEGAKDALQIIVAIIFNLNAPALFPVMQGHPRAEMFLQPALQVIDGRGVTSSQQSVACVADAFRRAGGPRDVRSRGRWRSGEGWFPRRRVVHPALSARARLWRDRRRANLASTRPALAHANRAGASSSRRPRGSGRLSARCLPGASQIHLRAAHRPALLRSGSGQPVADFRSAKLKHFQIGRDPRNHRHLRETGLVRRSPAAFAGNQFMPAVDIANNERLDDAVLAD